MQGLGKQHSTAHDPRSVGQRLVQGLSVWLRRRCPLAPQLYRQEKVCQAEEMAFQSKIELMEPLIRETGAGRGHQNAPPAGPLVERHIPWHAARERDVLVPTGLKSNRWLRVPDDTVAQGWRWQKGNEYAAGLDEQDLELLSWPRGGKKGSVHVVKTSVRQRSRCHIVIVRHDLMASHSQTYSRAESDLKANAEELLAHIATRWYIEVFFGENKKELGLDHSQVRGASALLRFWTRALLASVFLEEELQRLRLSWQRPVTIGEARRDIHRRCLLA